MPLSAITRKQLSCQNIVLFLIKMNGRITFGISLICLIDCVSQIWHQCYWVWNWFSIIIACNIVCQRLRLVIILCSRSILILNFLHYFPLLDTSSMMYHVISRLSFIDRLDSAVYFSHLIILLLFICRIATYSAYTKTHS